MGISPRTRTELYYSSRLGGPPQGVVRLPGRIVLLGEHVDHQGGPVLATPTREGVYVAWGVRPDHRVALHALNARATDAFEQGRIVRSGRRWADLARGACAVLAQDGRRLPGLNLVVYGDLPTRVGLASSAAYTAAILVAIRTATRQSCEPATVAQEVALVEREWAGVACGPMDPYVALAGQRGEVTLLDCASLTHEALPLPPTLDLGWVDTGIARRLSETPYNLRRQELADAWTALQPLLSGQDSLRGVSPEDFAAVAAGVPEPGRQRVRHVVTEIARVRAGAEALRAEDGARLGVLMNESHESLARDFDGSLPEIDAAVETLRGTAGVHGARLQGAGWGGSIAVLRTADE